MVSPWDTYVQCLACHQCRWFAGGELNGGCVARLCVDAVGRAKGHVERDNVVMMQASHRKLHSTNQTCTT